MGLKRFVNVVGWILIVFLLLWLCVTYFVNEPIFVSYTLTNSMEPVIGTGDLFLIQPYHPSIEFLTSLGMGDIIVFRSSSGIYLVHRIVGETASGFVTKGDNSPFTDQQGDEPYVTRDVIVGKAFTFQGNPIVVPKAGLALRQVSSFFMSNSLLVAGVVGVAGGSLLFLDKKKTRSFARRRLSGKKGLTIRHLYVISLVILSLFVFVPMTSGMITHRVEYVVTDKPIASERTVVKSGVLNRSVDLSNGGLVPYCVFLSSGDQNVRIEPKAVLQYPGSSTEILIVVQAEEEIGYYEKDVYLRKYLPILPLPLLRALMEINPYLPVLVIEAVMLSPFVLAYFLVDKRSIRFHRSSLWKKIRRSIRWR